MAPWDGINALDAMIQAFNNMNALRQSMKPTMRLHGVIVDGGKAANIIPFTPSLSLSELQRLYEGKFHFTGSEAKRA